VSQQIKSGSENSLIVFLKDNEALFTILGVFLVLAFIFNSAQVLTSYNAQNEPIQIVCVINGTNTSGISNTEGTQINCTGNLLIGTSSKDQITSGFTGNSKIFSFICLWMALIVYLLICYNLYYALRDCIGKIGSYFNNKAPSDNEVIRDCAILIIIPFFYQAAGWFLSLLISAFPDMSANAFITIMMIILLIQFISLLALSANINQNSPSKRKVIFCNLMFLVLGIILFYFAISLNHDLELLIIEMTMSMGFFGFGLLGIYRYFKKRNVKEYYEVN
jgi:hypothetical protein